LKRPLRIGTRGSALALWQTERIRTLLHSRGIETERVEIKTTGDLAPEIPLTRIGSRALFTRQIDEALLEGRIDLAVHSLKDLPTQLAADLEIAAVSRREDPTDALVGRGPLRWQDIPHGATIATSSLRRRAQLLLNRPDLHVVDLRGNIETRVSKLDAHSDWTAILLATAGLVRLGLEHRIGERLSPDLMLPAPGQGALAVTVRSRDQSLSRAVRDAVHDPSAGISVAAERGFLRRLEGGCQVPVGAYATQSEGGKTLQLHGRVVAPGGEAMIEGRERASVSNDDQAAALGEALAERLLPEGAAAILAGARTRETPAVSEP
jgi:hydroxymethylbilane synthase